MRIQVRSLKNTLIERDNRKSWTELGSPGKKKKTVYTLILDILYWKYVLDTHLSFPFYKLGSGALEGSPPSNIW
jgi:hypothetical protein